ncbi:unnamed protein product [Meganyctiphanes norvegica]|uniref:PH domain-containing protein n=1 Tax=Meganyctiphanes norvegica TaxID=48144 RepID=A0AAV2PPK8_MEGNR
MRVKKLKTSEKYTSVAGRSKISVEVEMRKRLGVWARRVLVLDGATLYAYKAKGDGGSVGGWEVGGADVHVGKGSDITREDGKHILVVAKQPAFKLTFAFSTIYEQSRLIQALSSSGAVVTGLDAILLLKNLTQKQKEEQEEERRRKFQEEADAHEWHQMTIEGQNDDIGRRRARSDAMLDPERSLTDIRWSFSEGNGAPDDLLLGQSTASDREQRRPSLVLNPLYDSDLDLSSRLIAGSKSVVPEDTFRRTASLPPAKRVTPGKRKTIDPVNPLPKPPRTASVIEDPTGEVLNTTTTVDGDSGDLENGSKRGNLSPVFPTKGVNNNRLSTGEVIGDGKMKDTPDVTFHRSGTSFDEVEEEFILPSDSEIDFTNEAQKIIDEIDADVQNGDTKEEKENHTYVNVAGLNRNTTGTDNSENNFDDLLKAMGAGSNESTYTSDSQNSNISEKSQDRSNIMGNKNSMNEIVNNINSQTAKDLEKIINSATENKAVNIVNNINSKIVKELNNATNTKSDKSEPQQDDIAQEAVEIKPESSLDELLAAMNNGNNPYLNGNNSDVEGQFDQLVNNMNGTNGKYQDETKESVTTLKGSLEGGHGSPTKSPDDNKINKISGDGTDKKRQQTNKNVLESKTSINKKELNNSDKTKREKQTPGSVKDKENKLEKETNKKQTQNKHKNETSKSSKKVSPTNSKSSSPTKSISSPTKSTTGQTESPIGRNKKETFKKYISEKSEENNFMTHQDSFETNHNTKKNKANEALNNKNKNEKTTDTTDSVYVTGKNNKKSNSNESYESKSETLSDKNTQSDIDQNKTQRLARKKSVELNSPLIISGQVELSGSAAGRLNPMYLEVRDGHVLSFPPKSATNTTCMSLQGMSVMPLLGMPNSLTIRKATRCMMVVKLESREEMLRWVRVLSDEVVRVTPKDEINGLTLYPSKSDQSKDDGDQSGEDDPDGRLKDLKNLITGKKKEVGQTDFEMNTIKKTNKHVTFRDEVQVIDESTPNVTNAGPNVKSLINQIKENHFGSGAIDHQPLKRLSGYGKQSPVRDEGSGSIPKTQTQKTNIAAGDTPNTVVIQETQANVDSTSNKDTIRNQILEEKQRIAMKEELRKKPVVKPTIKRHSIDTVGDNSYTKEVNNLNNHPVLRRLSGQGRWPPPKVERESWPGASSSPGLPSAEWEVTNILLGEGKVAPPPQEHPTSPRSPTNIGKYWEGNNTAAGGSVPLAQRGRGGSVVNRSWVQQPKKVEIIEHSGNNNNNVSRVVSPSETTSPRNLTRPVQCIMDNGPSSLSSGDTSDDTSDESLPGITWSVAAVREKFEMMNKVSGERSPRQLVTESPINRRKSTKNSLKKKKSHDGVARRGSIKRAGSRRGATAAGEVTLTPSQVQQQGSDSTDGGDTHQLRHQHNNMDLPQALAVKLIPVKERMKNFEVTNRRPLNSKFLTRTPLKRSTDIYKELVEIDKQPRDSVAGSTASSTPSHNRSGSPDSGIGVSSSNSSNISSSSSSSTISSLSPEPQKEVVICWRGPYIAQEAEQEVLNNINNAFLAKRRLLSKELQQARIRERLSMAEEKLWELQQSMSDVDEGIKNQRNPSWSSLERSLQVTEEEVESWQRRLVETQQEAESARQKLTIALHAGMAQLQKDRGN